MAKAKSPVPDGFHTVTPHLIFDNAAQAMDWYKQALGAEEKTRALGPDGKVIHGELQIGNSRIMLNDAMGGGRPHQQHPDARGASPVPRVGDPRAAPPGQRPLGRRRRDSAGSTRRRRRSACTARIVTDFVIAAHGGSSVCRARDQETPA